MSTTMPNRVVIAGLVVALVMTLVAGVSVTVQAQQERAEPPRTAVLARADNPVDALAAGAVAGQLGGIVLLTLSSGLSDAAETGLTDYDPELVVLAGGTGALSEQVRADVEALGYEVRRVAGANRFETAAELGALFGELGAAYLGVGQTAADSEQLEGHSLSELEAAYREIFAERMPRTTVVPNTGDPAADGATLRELVEGLDLEPDTPHRVLLDVGIYDLGDSPLQLPGGLILEGAGLGTIVAGNGSDDEADAPTLVHDTNGIVILKQLRVANDAHIDDDRRDWSIGFSVAGGLGSALFLEDATVSAGGADAQASALRTNGQVRVERSELSATTAASSATTAALDALRGNVIVHDSTLLGQNAGTNYGLHAQRDGTGVLRVEVRRSLVHNTHEDGAAMRVADVDVVTVRESEILNDRARGLQGNPRRGTALYAANATAEVHSSEVRGDTAFDRDPGGWGEFATSLLEGTIVGSSVCVHSYDENLFALDDKCL